MSATHETRVVPDASGLCERWVCVCGAKGARHATGWHDVASLGREHVKRHTVPLRLVVEFAEAAVIREAAALVGQTPEDFVITAALMHAYRNRPA